MYLHGMASTSLDRPSDREMFRAMARECVAFRVRRASRIVSRVYDRSLAAAGLTATQLTLLAAVANRPDLRMAELADELGFEPSSLSRSIALLVRKKWLRTTPASLSADRRERFFEVTDAGREMVRAAWQRWQVAQAEIEAALPGGVGRLVTTLDAIAALGLQGISAQRPAP